MISILSPRTFLALWFVCGAASLPAEPPKADPARLTLDRIFTANEFKEKTVETVRWSKLAPVYFTLEVRDEKAKEKQRDLVRNDAATGEKSVLVPAEALVPAGEKKALTVDSFEFSKDEAKLLLFTNTKKVWRRNTRGDYWVMDVAARKLRKLGGDVAASTLMFAKFSPDGSRVAFVRAGNLQVQDLSTMQITKLTTDGSATRFNGTSDWVNEEELGIRDGFRWSPDGTRIVFWQFDAEGVKKFWLVNNTETAYQRFTTFPYPKVGEKNSAVRLGVANASGGEVRWLEIPGDPREHYIPHVEWTEDGKQLLLQQFNRLQNTNRVLRGDPSTGETSLIFTETDAAWVENKNSIRWANDSLVWLSERSGWRHAYLASLDGQRCAPITTGAFDVIDIVSVDAKASWLYYLASPDNAAQRYLYRTRLQGGVPERLSPATQPGWHSYDISPDSQWAVHTYSSFTTPPVVELVQLPGHQVVRVLEDNRKVREKLAALTQPACEFLRVEVGGGVALDGWCIRPPVLDTTVKHPLLMHVYGEPASQTVKDSWGGQRTLWHWMLAQQGYVVASVDNRGTPSPRGREWRKCVYRQVGILAAQEQADAVRALLQRWPFTDAARVGVWGWSGGGSMSLNAIFRHPDLYRTAMAIAPVADRRLYNSIYEERYMGAPKDNAEGYRLASPITHAAGLKGNLLLVHGTGDDNVHYQATEKLMNELIAKNKTFTAMAYPNRSHSVSEGKGTSRHLFELLTNYLREHLPATPRLAQNSAPDFDRAAAFAKRIENKVFRATFTPHWLPDGRRFWYRVQTGEKTWEHVLVEAESGKLTRAADAASLGVKASVLTTSKDTTAAIRPSLKTGAQTSLRFTNRMAETVELVWIDRYSVRKSYGTVEPGTSRDLRTYVGNTWLVATATGKALGVIEAKEEPVELMIDGQGRATDQKQRDTSPDGRWSVRFAEHQIVLLDHASGESSTLTRDGTAARPYRGPVAWAPDGQSFVVLSVKDVPVRKVTIVESSPPDQLQPKMHTFDYAKPGDELPRPHPVLVRLADRQPLAIDDALFPNPFTPGGSLNIRWSPRSDEFTFDYNQRGHQLWRILAGNAQTGAVRTVVEETARTFIDYSTKTWRHWLDDTRELLWMSERDGWCHLWLYDAATGAVKNQVTRGAWVVRKVERVDAAKRQVWFLASGLRAGEDPYHRHLCRVNFDGSGFVRLTEGDGDHTIAFSPGLRFFTDRWSRADAVPVTELRRGEDGKLVCELERADATALLGTGWTMPERFVAKGRDGTTDIHGVLIKPSHFDPAKSYPVLEEVYAGPHGAFSPKTFFTLARQHALAELGFIIVHADGMGTNHRGKAFHDVAWKNLQDAGFPDRIAWIKAAAATRPWMDLTRVGIYGGSAGGQSAMRALLDHADFYQAAFADCGCHDNRMDKIWWNEQWLGWPVDESYVKASNVADAHKLRGALMLCVGELDRNVDPASTMQVANALQKAGNPFDLLVVTGAGHGAAETPAASRRRMEFFARHLQGGAAPDE